MQEQQTSMKKSKYTLSSLLFLALLIVTFSIIFYHFPLQDLLSTVLGLNGWYLLLGLVLILLYVAFEGQSMRIILKSFGTVIRPIRSFVYAATDLYYCAITPSASGGQPAMLYYMSKDNVHLAQSGMATLFNLVAYKIVLLTAGTATLIYKAAWITEHGGWVWWALIAFGFTVTLTLMLLCLASMFSPTLVLNLGTKGLRLLGRMRLVKRPEERVAALETQIAEYHEAAKIIRNGGLLFWKVLLCNLLQRLCMFSVTYCVYLSFGLSGMSYIDLLAVQVICALSVDTLPFPGGVGAAEAMTMALYGGIYPEALQTPAMLLTRGINFYFCVVVCAVTTFINHLRVWKRTPLEEGHLK